ncbi:MULTISPECIES: ribosome maturation factor RimM [Paenibacillus]|uniref:Ribosome maturation factor RimM n=1 Tax=Paenibacillus illinoisensis TaxID=59845 RepID=A0A2W0C2X6_9BACL|nr:MULTISPECIES: ribosome maturation factor RimM [Paenibacillus]MBM6382690.1 ribosome maturation factor RimM [Paenibacillus sp.]MBE7679297.1 ribosome maturation factor RimM [Paenibacillus sp. P13VS]MBY0218629.1 ribosome maturation factor RimM [Paenibacillus illinoisensis]PAD31944.1 ribosome maturation factor RimM [Paenibacillus sp. 7523-1]PYY26813.1 Ribosome maturation factor RimM [Paenibacillus illinoisensis]
MAEFMNVGKIVNTHGIRGELKIMPLTDFPEVRFAKNAELYLFTPDNHPVLVHVESARLHKNMYIVRLKEYGNINEVEKFKGGIAKVSKENLAELEENEYYFHQIVGCTVVTEEGENLGTISEILTPGANDVWVVKTAAGKEILLPVIDDVVLDVDVNEKLVKVHLMEGLL